MVEDARVGVRLKISALWVVLLFLYGQLSLNAG